MKLRIAARDLPKLIVHGVHLEPIDDIRLSVFINNLVATRTLNAFEPTCIGIPVTVFVGATS